MSSHTKTSSQSSAATNPSPDAELRDFLIAAGFTVYPRKGYFEAAHHDRGIALRWENKQPFLYRILIRPVAGRTRFETYGDYGPQVEKTILTNLRGAPKSQKRISLKNLPEPFRFQGVEYTTETHCSVDFWVLQTAIRMCRVVELVAIAETGVISPEAVAKPNNDVWYYVDCLGPEGSIFSIICDLDCENWYPINRETKKVTTNLQPKRSVDLTKMSLPDKRLLAIAIEDYNERTFGK